MEAKNRAVLSKEKHLKKKKTRDDSSKYNKNYFKWLLIAGAQFELSWACTFFLTSAECL